MKVCPELRANRPGYRRGRWSTDCTTPATRLWFDEFELTPGTAWGREIDKALKASRAMIVLVSAASMNSKEVRREIDHALLSQNFAHRVLPVYLEPTDDVPWFLRTQKGIPRR